MSSERVPAGAKPRRLIRKYGRAKRPDPASPSKQRSDLRRSISRSAEASSLFYARDAPPQYETRVKLNRVFFPR
jgi:hypothetical protein